MMKNTMVEELNAQFVNYEQFGAVGDGVADDAEAIRKAHNYANEHGLKVLAHDAAVGDGVIDFAEVLTAAKRCGCSYYVIEQKTDSPYCEIEKSFDTLTEIKNNMESM